MERLSARHATPEADRPVWLVTGASGFLGRPLLETLQHRRGDEVDVRCMGRRRPAGIAPEAFVEADLLDPRSVGQAIQKTGPSVVLHLAGRTPPASSIELYDANTLTTLLLLHALRDRGAPVLVVLAGSAAELGPVAEAELPVAEGHPCRPVEPYGMSKMLATAAGLAARPPLQVIVARVFNPIGPGLPESQALGRFASRFADPAPGVLSVGSLDTRRDFIDVRDVARAFLALAEHGQAGLVYHVGTGHSQRVGDGLERLRRLSGSRVRIAIDAERAAAAGPRDSRADIRRIVEHTGWRPEIAWETSLQDLWDEVRARPRLPLTA